MRFWRHLHMIGLPPSLRGQTADTNPHEAWISRHVRILPNFSPWLPPASVSHILAEGLALGFFTCICTFRQGPHKILVLKTIRFPLKMMTSHSSLRLREWQTDLFLTWPNTWRMIVSSKLKVCRKHEFVTCIDHLSLFTRATSSTFWKEIDHPLPQNWEVCDHSSFVPASLCFSTLFKGLLCGFQCFDSLAVSGLVHSLLFGLFSFPAAHGGSF